MWISLRKKRYEMDLEKVAVQAVKEKIQEVFDKITVTTEMEGKDIVIRIKLGDEIMNNHPDKLAVDLMTKHAFNTDLGLDKEAQAAANELLGTQPFIPQE